MGVQTAGSYRVEVRRWPREADALFAGVRAEKKTPPDAWLNGKPVRNLLYGGTPMALPVARVTLTIAGNLEYSEVKPSDCAAVFHVELPAGEHTINACLVDASGKDIAGAYYVCIRSSSSER